MQNSITAIRLDSLSGIVSPRELMEQVQNTVSMTTRNTSAFARQKGQQMKEAALLPFYSTFYSVASSIIPDDAYDWEGDMFEEDHIPGFSLLENKEFQTLKS